jgi:hypothetical protein
MIFWEFWQDLTGNSNWLLKLEKKKMKVGYLKLIIFKIKVLNYKSDEWSIRSNFPKKLPWGYVHCSPNRKSTSNWGWDTHVKYL